MKFNIIYIMRNQLQG